MKPSSDSITTPFDLGPEHEGLSLEDRRLARRELLARYLAENPRELRRAKRALNTIAQYDPTTGERRVVDRYASDYAKVVGAVPDRPITTTVDLPPQVKRSREQRVEAMLRRLQALPPHLMEAKLQELARDSWKAGQPITGEQLKAAAAAYLNRRGVDRNYTQPIQVTRTKSTGE